MKFLSFAIAFTVIFQCPMDPSIAQPITVPSSDRSIEASQRVMPMLTCELYGEELKLGAPVFLRIFKEEGVLEIWLHFPAAKCYKLFKTYPIQKFSGTLGPKLKEGDGQAPEGVYSVLPQNLNPNSNFHLSFNLGFPNEFDRTHNRTGSYLMVHGSDCSIGCYAMGDPGIEEIFTLCSAALRNGQSAFQVHCHPFRLTDERLEREKDSQWYDFWKQLKAINDAFEENHLVPKVGVKAGRYEVKAGG